jgi:Bifunctional DNA primase/polymerase, N-terminal
METARAMSELVLSPQSARDFRDPASVNGYRLVPVRTGSKQPVGKDWQHGADTERLRNVTKDELNTGILAAGLRCLDVDVDDPQIAAAIKTKIVAHFPGATFAGAPTPLGSPSSFVPLKGSRVSGLSPGSMAN